MVGKLENDALMEEYKTLRTEIAQRVQSQFVITGANLAFFSAVLVKLPDWSHADDVNLLLGLPLITPIITWLYYEQDVFVSQAAGYLHNELRPVIMARAASETPGGKSEDFDYLMGWENYRNKVLFQSAQNRSFMMKLVVLRLLANIGPGVTMLVVGIGKLHKTVHLWRAVSLPTWLLVTFDVVAIAFAAQHYSSVFGRYLGIALGKRP